MCVKSYQQLRVRQTGMELTRSVYQLSEGFPRHEVYGLTSQLRRAAVSIPANLAEGHARSSTKEFLHHVSIAQGSLAELETLLLLAEKLGYRDGHGDVDLLDQCDREGKMLRCLRSASSPSCRSQPQTNNQ